MKEIFVRALSGSVYAFAIIGSLLYNEIIFYSILLLFVSLTVFEFEKLTNNKSFFSYIFLIIIWVSFVQLDTIYKYYLKFLIVPTLLSHVLLILWLYSKFDITKKKNCKKSIKCFLYYPIWFFYYLLDII